MDKSQNNQNTNGRNPSNRSKRIKIVNFFFFYEKPLATNLAIYFSIESFGNIFFF